MKRVRLTLWLLALACGLLAGYAAARWLVPGPLRPEPWAMPGEWIAAPEQGAPVAYFRKTLELPAAVRHAWLAIAATDGFELSVNGTVIGMHSLWRPNRSFQFASTERGQRVNHTRPLPGVSYAREYQWETAAHYRVPVFFDLSGVLKPGRNLVAIRVDTRSAVHRLRIGGAITLASTQQLRLASDQSWKATDRPGSTVESDWFEPEFPDHAWPAARVVSGPEDFLRTFDPAVFATPFTAPPLGAPAAAADATLTFETTWPLENAPRHAWLRLRTNRAYDLTINGRRVEPPTLGSDELTSGNWIIHTLLASGQRPEPLPLDPEDGSLFGDEGTALRNSAPAGTQRDSQVETFEAVELGTLLRPGLNHLSIRLSPRGAAPHWLPQLAVDAAADGTPLAGDWRLSVGGGPATAVARLGETTQERPALRYLGAAAGGSLWRQQRAGIIVAAVIAALSLAAILQRGPASAAHGVALFGTAATILSGAVTLDRCFAPRDEALVTATGGYWPATLLLAAAAGCVTLLLLRTGWRLPRDRHRLVFAMAFGLVLFICGFTRAFRADEQPTDADEWASLQTILAIVETGTPRLTAEAYYTRSPFYHYLTAGSVALFGPTFWAMRLPAAGFAVGTCALLVLCGTHLLRNRWVGLGAALIFALHPLAIDMAHQVRFYQQQQFFALLAYYAFCRGFLGTPHLGWRYGALAAFFGAVFSQEISIMIPLAFVPAYLLFGRSAGWRQESRWLLAAACGMVFVVLDFVIFQTVCLTRLEGVSPSIEPALKLNALYPSKLYWIFTLFSRLHVALTVTLVAALPLLLRTRDRQVTTMLLTFGSGIVFSTILITGVGLRFQYWLFPLFFLLAVHGARLLTRAALTPARRWLGRETALPQGALAAVIVAVIVCSFSPWKLPGSYETKLLPDVDAAFAYVRQHLVEGDALAVAAPHTAAAKCEIGRVDYDIELPLLHDFVYRKDGRLIDRNGSAEVIDKVDELQDALARHGRVWVVLNRDIRFRSPGSRIGWQTPGARFDLFVRTNLQLMHQSYLTDVYLWDRSRGRLRGFRRTM